MVFYKKNCTTFTRMQITANSVLIVKNSTALTTYYAGCFLLHLTIAQNITELSLFSKASENNNICCYSWAVTEDYIQRDGHWKFLQFSKFHTKHLKFDKF